MSITQSQIATELVQPGSLAKQDEVIPLTVEFSGGLELFFSNRRKHFVSLPAEDAHGKPSDLGFLIQFLCENLMKDRRTEMFVIEGSVRPGILVLVNDADWELEGGERYQIQKDDNILFVSTLHGG